MSDPTYTWTDHDGDQLHVAQDCIVIVEQSDGATVSAHVAAPTGEDAVEFVRAVLGEDTGYAVVDVARTNNLMRMSKEYGARSMRERAVAALRAGNWDEDPTEPIRALPLLPDGDTVEAQDGARTTLRTDPAPSEGPFPQIRHRVQEWLESDTPATQVDRDRFTLLERVDRLTREVQEQPTTVHVATPEGITPCGQGTRDVTTDGMITDITCVECLRAIAIEKGEQPGEMRRELEAALKAGRGTSWPSLIRQVRGLRARGEDTPEGTDAGAHRTRTWTTETADARPATPADLPHIMRQMDEWTREAAAVTDLRRSPLADRVAQLERDSGGIQEFIGISADMHDAHSADTRSLTNRLNLLEVAQGRVDRLHDRVDALELAARESAQSGGAEHVQVAGGSAPEPCPVTGWNELVFIDMVCHHDAGHDGVHYNPASGGWEWDENGAVTQLDGRTPTHLLQEGGN